MCTLAVQIEEELHYLTEVEKEGIVLRVSQKEIEQLIEGLHSIQLHNKKRK